MSVFIYDIPTFQTISRLQSRIIEDLFETSLLSFTEGEGKKIKDGDTVNDVQRQGVSRYLSTK